MKYQVFVPILLLQFIQLFWYFLILRIAYRCVFTSRCPSGDIRFPHELMHRRFRGLFCNSAVTEFKADDTRSDDEDDDEPDEDERSSKDD